MFSRWCEGKESRGKELRGTQQIPFPNIGSDLELQVSIKQIVGLLWLSFYDGDFSAFEVFFL